MGRGPIWLPIAATLCMLGIGGAAWRHGDQAEVRERLARFVAEQDARAASTSPREAAHGDTIDGDASDDYKAASDVLIAIPLRWRNVDNGRRTELTCDGRPLTEEARRANQPSLDRALQSIQLGVRRSRIEPRKCNLATFALEVVVADAIDRAYAARDARKLAELFVDRWVLHGDLWNSWVQPPEFRDEWLHVLDPESAAWFGAALRRLDERQPAVAPLAAWISYHVRKVADLTPLQQSFMSGLRAWRWGFDSHWRELVACDRLVAALPEIEPPARDWERRNHQVFGLAAHLRECHGGYAIDLPEFVLSHEAHLRRVLTRLRMLRLAVAFVSGLDLPALEDPLGAGRIAVEIRGDEATFRSEGMDGEKRIERTVRRR